MKTATVILGLSLAANAALLGVVAFSGRDAPPVDTPPPPAAPVFSPTARAVAADAAPTESPDLVTLLKGGDPEVVRDLLRSAGVPDEVVRVVVGEMISRRYRARIQALFPGGEPAAENFWQRQPRVDDVTTMIERNRLFREMSREITRVLGPGGMGGRASERFAFLPEDKRRQLETIESDYNEMRGDLSAATAGFQLKSDRDLMRMLEEEKQRDIEALLSPDEREMLRLRTSATTARVRGQYGSVLESEEQFRAVYALQKAFDDHFNPDGVMGTLPGGRAPNPDAAARRAAEEQLREQIHALLGPERVARLALERDPDYRTMQAASARLGLGADAIDRVLGLRADAASASQRIMSDPSLAPEARSAALAALASSVREQLTQVMGADGGESFAERAGWLRALEQGSTFSVRPEGGVSIERGPRP